MKKLKVEKVKLNNGVRIPSIGIGTWQIPNSENLVLSLQSAIELGYRYIDTAAIYENELSVAEAIRRCGVKRSEFFISSKCWAANRTYDSVMRAFEESLRNLKLDYLDCYLIHWPYTKGEPLAWQSVNIGTWRAFEKLYEEGLVKTIGISNFQIHHLVSFLARANVAPAINQLEFHPGYTQRSAVSFCKKNGITVEANTLYPLLRRLENQGLLKSEWNTKEDKPRKYYSITKDGKVAGPKLLEHMVDAVFNFEGEEGLFYRILRSTKNRFGSTNELAVFSMEEDGMKEIKNSSEYFLSEREEKNIGSMVVPVLEGTKVFLLEIQTLLTDVTIGIPKRIVQGFDRNRIQILTAIAEKKMYMSLAMKDIFVNIPGGLNIEDPAADLAVLISMLSIYKGVEISQKIAAIGELGLRGEIRKVFFIDKRLRELEKLGFKGVYIPEANRKEIEKNNYNLKLIYLKNLEELLERMNKDGQ